MPVDSPVIQKLIQIPAFRGLTEDEGKRIFDISQEVPLKKGDTLFKEGDPGDALYAILEGALEVQKADRSGASQALAQVGEGGVLGEMALLGGTQSRSATVMASRDARLLKIPSQGFSRLLRNDDLCALKIVYNLAQVMSRRLLMMDEKLVDLLGKGKKKEELMDFQKILSNWSF